jgi:hypothetical protein
MKMLYQTQAACRQFHGENPDLFRHWHSTDDDHSAHMFSPGEAAALFLALCAAVNTLAKLLDNSDKIIKKTKALIEYSTAKLGGASSPAEPTPFTLDERILVLVFDSTARNGSGLSSTNIAALVGEKPEHITTTLDRLHKLGAIQQNKKTGNWVAVS